MNREQLTVNSEKETANREQWQITESCPQSWRVVKALRQLTTTLLIVCYLLIGTGCKDVFEPPKQDKPETETGYFSLSINKLDMGRTILPATVQDDFTAYTLEFFKDALAETNPCQLSAGVWAESNLTEGSAEHWYTFPVTEGATYRVWWNDRNYGDNTKTGYVAVAARYENGTFIFGSSASSTSVTSDWTSPRSFTAASTGTVSIRVIPYGRSNSYTGTYSIVYTENNSTRPDSVIVDAFPFASSVEPDIIEERIGANLSDPVFLPKGTWDLLVSAYMDEEDELPAAQGSLQGINITGDVVSDTVTLKPIVGGGEGTFSWNIGYPDDDSVVSASMTIIPLAVGGTPEQTLDLMQGATSFTLNTGYYHVVFKLCNNEGKNIERWETLHIYRNMESNCTHVFEAGNFNDISLSVTAVGSSLAEQLAWVSDNALGGMTYMLEVSADESLNPHTLSYGEWRYITLHLKGIGSERIVSLAGNGSLFTIEDGVTLVLDENITLQGHENNNASLVKVNGGGELLMNTGSKITGNTSSNSGGGVYVYNDGTFTMNGGEISGNTASYYGGGGGVSNGGTFTMNGGEISGNTADGWSAEGGGVCVFSGTFTMNGGEISNNTNRNTGSSDPNNPARSGGGVYVKNGATFHIVTGAIYGSGEAEEIRNTVIGTGGAALYRNRSSSGTAEFGTFSGNTWNANGVLGTTNDTIRVVNGVLSGAGTPMPDNYVFNVATVAEWNSALKSIAAYGSDKNYTINVTADFSVPGRADPSFGGAQDVTVSLQGPGRTVSLSGNGSILRIDANQTVILQDLSLRGHNSNNTSLVYVTGTNAIFTMEGGEITGNTSSDYSYGGGVYVGRGTFTMNGGEISSNTAPSGGGVYVDGGTFTMSGGEITGNTSSSYGGGVYVGAGTFRMVTGTIYGSGEAMGIRNTATNGNGAALYGNGQHGTFNGEEWNTIGSLGTTNDTIRVVEGELVP